MLCTRICIPALFGQGKDSLALELEMQRINRLRDSMREINKARESTFNAMLEGAVIKTQRSIEEGKRKEMAHAMEEVLQRQEKEQASKRKTMLLAISAFLFTIIVTGVFLRRKNKLTK